MFIVIAFMVLGGITGYFLQKKGLDNISKIIIALIWLLLLLLGMEVGSNPDIVTGLATIGLEALIIAIATALGSAVMAFLLWKQINKGKK
jgi:Na+/proline symporter